MYIRNKVQSICLAVFLNDVLHEPEERQMEQDKRTAGREKGRKEEIGRGRLQNKV